MRVVNAHPNERRRYCDGDQRLIGSFMGQVIRRALKVADAGRVRELLADARS